MLAPICCAVVNIYLTKSSQTLIRITIHQWIVWGLQLLITVISWWSHQMEPFSALLVICEGNPTVAGGFPSQRAVTWSFDVFYLRLNKRLCKPSRRRWFETPLRTLWRHCNVLRVTSAVMVQSSNVNETNLAYMVKWMSVIHPSNAMYYWLFLCVMTKLAQVKVMIAIEKLEGKKTRFLPGACQLTAFHIRRIIWSGNCVKSLCPIPCELSLSMTSIVFNILSDGHHGAKYPNS